MFHSFKNIKTHLFIVYFGLHLSIVNIDHHSCFFMNGLFRIWGTSSSSLICVMGLKSVFLPDHPDIDHPWLKLRSSIYAVELIETSSDHWAIMYLIIEDLNLKHIKWASIFHAWKIAKLISLSLIYREWSHFR